MSDDFRGAGMTSEALDDFRGAEMTSEALIT